jgi:hypothetical protein
VGIGEIDDLSGVGRIGYDFLVPAQDGVEDYFTCCEINIRSYQLTFKYCPVSKD